MRATRRRPLGVLHVDRAAGWGGGQNQVRLLVRGLVLHPDIRSGVFTSAGSRLAGACRALGVPVTGTPWHGPMSPATLRALARELRNGWDVAHAHGSHALQVLLAARALVGRPVPIVASRRVAFPVRSRAAWERADRVLVVSRAARHSLTASGLNACRIRLVADGIDADELLPQAPGRLRGRTGADPGTPLVAALGALVPSKGHDTFLKAAALVTARWPGPRFAVFGDGPLRRELDGEISRLGLERRFVLAGEVPAAARSLIDLDVFVMPSRIEGFGSAALEAMAVGRPVVLSDGGGLADLAGDGVPTVPAGDPEALAADILGLLRDPQARRRRVEAGRRRAATFTAARMVGRTVETYREVTVRTERRATALVR